MWIGGASVCECAIARKPREIADRESHVKVWMGGENSKCAKNINEFRHYFLFPFWVGSVVWLSMASFIYRSYLPKAPSIGRYMTHIMVLLPELLFTVMPSSCHTNLVFLSHVRLLHWHAHVLDAWCVCIACSICSILLCDSDYYSPHPHLMAAPLN